MSASVATSSSRAGKPSPGSGNREGTRWRGKLKVPRHAHPLVRFIYAEMNRQDTTLTELAAEVGMTRNGLAGWGRDCNPQLPLLEAALNALGYDLLPVRRGAKQ